MNCRISHLPGRNWKRTSTSEPEQPEKRCLKTSKQNSVDRRRDVLQFVFATKSRKLRLIRSKSCFRCDMEWSIDPVTLCFWHMSDVRWVLRSCQRHRKAVEKPLQFDILKHTAFESGEAFNQTPNSFWGKTWPFKTLSDSVVKIDKLRIINK